MDTPRFDDQERSEISCAVLGCPSTGEFRLIDLSRDEIPLPDDEAIKMRDRGMYFVGTLGYVNGTIAATCDDTKDPIDGALMLSACLEFANRLQPKDDGSGWVQWLERLWSLPGDTPEN